MECPKCQKAMQPIKIGDFSIDECFQCKGLWFDKGELEKFKEIYHFPAAEYTLV